MNQHFVGLVAFVVSVTVSTILVWAGAQFGSVTAPAHVVSSFDTAARTYQAAEACMPIVCGPVGGGEPSSSWQRQAYNCSDGAKLYVVTEHFRSRDTAEAALTRRRRLANLIEPPSPIASSNAHTVLGYYVSAEVALELNRLYTPTTFVAFWSNGSEVTGVYGPTESHVRELDALLAAH